ncbi:Vps62-related protein [Streptomyces sp. 1222.5]|uniref:Vps62-related protein n=1 Tax=Streptomyces sp. 1222.5 TaxID=1881026 RepID=UPI003EB7F03E
MIGRVALTGILLIASISYPATAFGAARSGTGGKPGIAVESALTIKPMSSFIKVYDDRGTGAHNDIAIWRPNERLYPGFRSLGDIAMDTHEVVPQNTFLVKDVGNVLAAPSDYREVWNDKGSGGDLDGSIWEPVAPAGYTCLGAVGVAGYGKPSLNAMRCVRSDLTVAGRASKVWDDAGSGAVGDASVWQADAADYLGLTSSTFHASASHGSPGPSSYRVLDKRKTSLFQAVREQDDPGRARSLAPNVSLAPMERYNPSSVGFFLDHVHADGGYLTTNNPLGCASCTDPAFLDGQVPGQVPLYAQIIRKTDSDGVPTAVTDTFYWMFYPYNNGKRICVGAEVRGTCLGGWSTFGNHVGDWEHLTVRSMDGLPDKVVLSQHSGAQIFDFGDKRLRLTEGQQSLHPEVFSASGSHALYPDIGNHTYKRIFNGSSLIDVTGYGARWSGAPVSVFTWQSAGNYSGEFSWMNLTERWGNLKDGCAMERLVGECVRNSGPTPPQQKGFAQPPLSAPVG